MEMTLKEISRILGGTVIGRDDVVIKNIMSIEEANEGDLTFIANKKYLKKTEADSSIGYSCSTSNCSGRQKSNYCGRSLCLNGEIIN